MTREEQLEIIQKINEAIADGKSVFVVDVQIMGAIYSGSTNGIGYLVAGDGICGKMKPLIVGFPSKHIVRAFKPNEVNVDIIYNSNEDITPS